MKQELIFDTDRKNFFSFAAFMTAFAWYYEQRLVTNAKVGRSWVMDTTDVKALKQRLTPVGKVLEEARKFVWKQQLKDTEEELELEWQQQEKQEVDEEADDDVQNDDDDDDTGLEAELDAVLSGKAPESDAPESNPHDSDGDTAMSEALANDELSGFTAPLVGATEDENAQQDEEGASLGTGPSEEEVAKEQATAAPASSGAVLKQSTLQMSKAPAKSAAPPPSLPSGAWGGSQVPDSSLQLAFDGDGDDEDDMDALLSSVMDDVEAKYESGTLDPALESAPLSQGKSNSDSEQEEGSDAEEEEVEDPFEAEEREADKKEALEREERLAKVRQEAEERLRFLLETTRKVFTEALPAAETEEASQNLFSVSTAATPSFLAELLRCVDSDLLRFVTSNLDDYRNNREYHGIMEVISCLSSLLIIIDGTARPATVQRSHERLAPYVEQLVRTVFFEQDHQFPSRLPVLLREYSAKQISLSSCYLTQLLQCIHITIRLMDWVSSTKDVRPL